MKLVVKLILDSGALVLILKMPMPSFFGLYPKTEGWEEATDVEY